MRTVLPAKFSCGPTQRGKKLRRRSYQVVGTCVFIYLHKFYPTNYSSAIAELSGWWDKTEVKLMIPDGEVIAHKFVVQHSTYFGNSAQIKSPWHVNWECVIAGMLMSCMAN